MCLHTALCTLSGIAVSKFHCQSPKPLSLRSLILSPLFQCSILCLIRIFFNDLSFPETLLHPNHHPVGFCPTSLVAPPYVPLPIFLFPISNYWSIPRVVIGPFLYLPRFRYLTHVYSRVIFSHLKQQNLLIPLAFRQTPHFSPFPPQRQEVLPYCNFSLPIFHLFYSDFCLPTIKTTLDSTHPLQMS